MREPRVLVLSFRQVRRTPANSVLFEFEDAVASFDDAEVVCVEDYHASLRLRASERAQLVARIATGGRLGRSPVVPYPRLARLTHDYDLLIAVCDSPWDLPLLECLDGWRDRCGAVTCFIAEAWPVTFESARFRHEPLDLVDHVFAGAAGDAPLFASLLGGRASYLVPAVDALAFRPASPDARRRVDLTSIGRRAESTHEALLGAAAKRGWLYHYEPFGLSDVPDHRAHRRWLADLLRDTRFLVANYARADRPDLTRGWREVGYRWFEGAAAGCVMIGDPPTTAAFREQFAWPDAVVPIEFGSSEVDDLLTALEDDPERVAAARRHGVHGSLTGHDWVYRWGDVLATVGLPETEAMAARREALARAATDWAS